MITIFYWAHRFFNKYSVHNVVGVIDCTHVAIFPHSANDEIYPEHIYVNRKGYHSINTQLVSANCNNYLNYCSYYNALFNYEYIISYNYD